MDFGWVDGAQKLADVGATTGSSTGTSLTASGSTNTMGSWTQLTGSSAIAATGILLSGYFTAPSGAGYGLLQIGIGSAGSEVTVITGLPMYRLSSMPFVWNSVLLPCRIPSGTRVAARFQASQASATCVVSGVLVGGNQLFPMLSGKSESIGAVSATSKGTQIDPGGTAHTKGSWVQLSSSTGIASRYILLSLTDEAPAAFGAQRLIDIGVGGAGSEVVVAGNIFAPNSSAFGIGIQRKLLPLAIPAGSRVAVRAQCDSATSGNRQFLSTINLFG